MGSTAGRIVRNTGWLYAKMGITMFISLWTTRLILGSLGESDFGIFGVVGGTIAMLGFLNAAMATATQRFMSYAEGAGNESKIKVIFNVSTAIHTTIALVVGVVLMLAAFIFFGGLLKIPEGRETAAVVVYISMVLSTMFTVMTVPYDAVMNAHENMKYYAIVGVFESLLKLSVAYVCVYTSHDKLIVYGILMALIPFVTLTVMRVYCHTHYDECVIAPGKFWDRGVLREMLSFAGWNFVGTTSTMICQYGMGIVLNYFFGTILNAAHSIATQLNGQVMAFSNNLMKAVNPVISKSEGAGDRTGMLAVSFTGCKFAYFTIAVFAVPLIIEAPYILNLWLKGIVPDHAVIFTQLLIARSALEQVTGVFSTSIAAEGRIKSMNLWVSGLTVFTMILSVVVFMSGGDASWIYILYLGVFAFGMTLVKLVIMHINCGMQYAPFLRDVMVPMVVVTSLSVAGGLVPHFIMGAGFLRLVVVTLSSVLLFVASIYPVGLTAEERVGLRNLVSSVLKK